uniref:CCHC-type domain-containing protein n=1 Tax=Scleropages formosus TaxID=113540 RepID=A0A8C9RRV9_SCLFO
MFQSQVPVLSVPASCSPVLVQCSSPVFRHVLGFQSLTEPQEEDRDFHDRLTFIKEVILGLLGLTVEDVICIQLNNLLRFFDVTLTTELCFKKMIENCRTFNRWVNNQRIVTVHVFNPFISAESIREFLQRYVEVLPGYKDMRDELGLWNGKRQFRIRLLPDPQGFDGFRHPPATFNLGTSKGYLFYSNQPPFCRVCQGFWHRGAECTNMWCNNCLERGHMAKDCKGPRRCNVCGTEDHLAHTCSHRKPSLCRRRVGKPGVWRKGGRDVFPTQCSGAGEARDVRVASPAPTLEEIQKWKKDSTPKKMAHGPYDGRSHDFHLGPNPCSQEKEFKDLFYENFLL